MTPRPPLTLNRYFCMGLFAGATLLAFASTVQSAVELAYEGETVPWIGLLKARLVDWYGCALFIPFLYSLASASPIGRHNWQRHLPLHLTAGLVFALCKEILFVLVGNFFRPGVFHLPEILAGDYLDEVLFFWGVIALIHFYQRAKVGSVAGDMPRSREGFVARLGDGGYKLIPSEQVEWIDAQGNYARLHTPNGAFLVRETMATLGARLEPNFARVHRRVIVNRSSIAAIKPGPHGAYRIILHSGEEVVAGRTFGHTVRSLIR